MYLGEEAPEEVFGFPEEMALSQSDINLMFGGAQEVSTSQGQGDRKIEYLHDDF